MFKAEIIADSLSPTGDRLTTFVVTFPRIILAEFNTHRMFSRNSASSRAIPFEKMVKAIMENPFIPIEWQVDHKGMQGTKYITEQKDINLLKAQWLLARDNAVKIASELNGGILEYIGNVENNGTQIKPETQVTKQLCNRLLEPFMWHTVIVTASEWENFFALRAHEAAEIHMQKIAYMMLNAYNISVPKKLKAGQWHVPFLPSTEELSALSFPSIEDNTISDAAIKIATARCARVSYTVVGEEEKKPNYQKDIELHDNLLAGGHMSPFEHCARVMTTEEREYLYLSTGPEPEDFHSGVSGNFVGFIPYRKMLGGENRTDERVTLYKK